jgi:hypothetical protein
VTDFWIGSDEYPRWWDGPPAHVVRRVPSDGAHGLELMLVEVESSGEQILLGHHLTVPLAPGRPVAVREFTPPDGWDGREPLREADLRFRSEAGLYARPEELPVVTAEERERVRRGWAW